MLLSDKDNERLDTRSSVIIETEDERLRRDIYRSDKEKFLLFIKMLRRNALIKKAKITHK